MLIHTQIGMKEEWGGLTKKLTLNGNNLGSDLKLYVGGGDD